VKSDSPTKWDQPVSWAWPSRCTLSSGQTQGRLRVREGACLFLDSQALPPPDGIDEAPRQVRRADPLALLAEFFALLLGHRHEERVDLPGAGHTGT